METGTPDPEKNASEATVGDAYGFSRVKLVTTPLPSSTSGITVAWPPVTAVGAGLTVTLTGIERETPVPVTWMVALYGPAVVKDAVFKATDKVAGWEWLTLKLAAESPIHNWLALAVSDIAAVDVVLN